MSPYTAKQRRFFHAAAERGEPGMAKMAAEADMYARAGEEKPAMKKVKPAKKTAKAAKKKAKKGK